METYIRKKIKGFYINFTEEIDPEYWVGKIGSTVEDFEADKWIHLSIEQLAFHNEHPEATVEQVITMTLPEPYVRSLEDAKWEKFVEIDNYDESNDVNSFDVTYNNETFSAWLTPVERSNYRSSIESAELVGVDTLSLYVSKHPITLSVENAKLILAQIQLYADQCYIVTQQHKNNIEQLNSIEEVDNYDNTTGYPTRLSFSIN